MDLSIFWRLKDLISPAVERVIRTANHAQEVMAKVNTSMQRGFRDSGETINSLRQKIKDMEASRNAMRIGVDTRQITAANGQIDKLNRQLDKLEGRNRQAEGRGGLLSNLMPRGLGVGLGLSAAVAGFGGFVKMGMEREMITAQFAQFTKSNETAVQAVNDLNKYADKTPYLNDDILKVGAKIAMNFSPNEIMDKVKMIGDIAGGNAGRMESIQLALSQVRAKGHLMGQDSNQFADALVPIREYLAKVKGVGIDKIAKLTEQGKISYADVEAALKKMTSQGEIFYGFMDKLALTTQGKWSTLVGTIRNKFTELSMAQSGWLNSGIDFVNRFLESMQPIETALSGLGAAFAPAIAAVRDLLVHLGLINPAGDSVQQLVSLLTNVINILATGVQWAGTMLGWLVSVFEAIPFSNYVAGFLAINYALKSIRVFQAISAILTFTNVLIGSAWATSIFKTSWLGLNTAFAATPIGLIITAVVALVAAIYYAWTESEKFREVMYGVWGGVKAVWDAVAGFLGEVWTILKIIGKAIADSWNEVVSVIRELWTGLITWFAATEFGQGFFKVFDAIGQAWGRVMEVMKGWWDNSKDYIITGFRVMLGLMTLGLSELGIAIYKQFNKGYKVGVGDFAQIKIDDKAKAALEEANKSRLLLVENQKLKFLPNSVPKPPQFPTGMGGSDASKTGGITDTVEGAKSRSITINLNKGLIETSNIIVDSKGTGLDIERQVLDALNRVLRSGDRLAFE